MEIFKKYFSKRPITPLHHYTSFKGFLGILNEEKFRATNIFYMNDQSEMNRAITLLHDELHPRITSLNKKILEAGPRALGPETNPDIIRMSASLRFLEAVKDITADFMSGKRAPYYVCSFSELPDDLSQWRAYSQDGNGICISYNFNSFESDLVLAKCKYNEEEQKAILKELIDYWFNQFTKSSESHHIESCPYGSSEGFIDTAAAKSALECLFELFKIAPFLKHPKYTSESEWRIVLEAKTETLDNMIVVDSPQLLKPCYCLDISSLPSISQIMVGPSSHIDLNKSAARTFVRLKNISPDIVSASIIPYRGKI